MSTGIFIPMTKCAHDIPYHGCTHETNSSSSSSLVFTGDIIKQQLELNWNLTICSCHKKGSTFFTVKFI